MSSKFFVVVGQGETLQQTGGVSIVNGPDMQPIINSNVESLRHVAVYMTETVPGVKYGIYELVHIEDAQHVH